MTRVLAEGRNLKNSPEKASYLMAQRQIRLLPILYSAKKLVAIVTLGDLAVHGENQQRSGDVLEQVSTPAHPNREISER